jgi:adenylate kinase
VILKIVPKAGNECTQEKSTNGSKEKPEQFLELVPASVFKEANKNFILILELDRLKI